MGGRRRIDRRDAPGREVVDGDGIVDAQLRGDDGDCAGMALSYQIGDLVARCDHQDRHPIGDQPRPELADEHTARQTRRERSPEQPTRPDDGLTVGEHVAGGADQLGRNRVGSCVDLHQLIDVGGDQHGQQSVVGRGTVVAEHQLGRAGDVGCVDEVESEQTAPGQTILHPAQAIGRHLARRLSRCPTNPVNCHDKWPRLGTVVTISIVDSVGLCTRHNDRFPRTVENT